MKIHAGNACVCTVTFCNFFFYFSTEDPSLWSLLVHSMKDNQFVVLFIGVPVLLFICSFLATSGYVLQEIRFIMKIDFLV